MTTLLEDLGTFVVLPRSLLVRLIIFLTKFIEKIKTQTARSTFFFFFENRALYEIMWEDVEEPDWPQMKT